MEQVYINIKDLGDCYLKRFLEKAYNRDLLSVDDLLTLIEDLINAVDDLKEKYDDLQEDLEQNYRPIPYAEQVEVYDHDFI